MSDLARLISSGLVETDVPLGPLTTYKAGGPARYLSRPEDESDLGALIAAGLFRDLPVLVLGRGSNLLVSSHGFPGVVVVLGSGFTTVDVRDDQVTAGSGAPLPRLARAAVEEGVLGLEFFVGIPGSVGGAIRQNAGCFGTETRDRLVSADVIDLTDGTRTAPTPDDLDLSYRHSNLRNIDLVLAATFQGHHGDRDEGLAEIRRITRWRRDNQPGGTLNAGSVFKNPAGTSAGELIDRLGLKGTSVGDVTVSEKHANFFVAGPAATPEEIAGLIQLVKDRVFELSGTILETEIQLVGFDQ